MRKNTPNPTPPYDRTRERNPFWKGGRSVASNGYVLIKVGTDHHLADVRGYAYEHRLVAEQKIGRRLLPGEQVHHIDGDKQNNSPDNLEVAESCAHHQVMHRTTGTAKRLPGEDNPLIACACGCGLTLLKYDDSNRSRQFITGHNPPDAPAQALVIRLLYQGAVTPSDLSARFGFSPSFSRTVLSLLGKKGIAVRVARGVWQLKEQANG